MNATLISVSRIAVDIAAPVARITLHNPPLNVIDIPMMEQLLAALQSIESDPRLSVVMFAGDGKAFSAGVDVGAHTPDKVGEMLAQFHAVVRALLATKKVTIATVHGHCLGGGSELAMVCDIVYTASDACWGFPEIKLGCYPPVACAALAALIGQKQAAEMILTGRTISGQEAAEIGLATRAVSADSLKSAAEECVRNLVHLSPAALALAKKACYAWDSMHFDKGLARAEKIYFEELMKTADANEGIRAFLERRPPVWTGN